MKDAASRDALDESREAAYSTPLDQFTAAQADRFADDTMWPWFQRLREEAPVHWCETGAYEPHWSITRYEDIMAIDTDHRRFSSASGIVLQTPESRAHSIQRGTDGAGFITMDNPQHNQQRKQVAPAFTPPSLDKLKVLLRERAANLLDTLPVGETFDWVDLVSKEYTAMTLATLFDFPFEDRRKLTYWSDIITNTPGFGPVTDWDQKFYTTMECFTAFDELLAERKAKPPSFDLISMLAHGEGTRDMPKSEYHGNVVLLIVGGNDTTRNTLSGSVYALNKHPDQYDRLRADPSLIPAMVSETIRWQTPLAHMARVALEDVEMHGQTIRKGDRVIMWYVSGNRDETRIDDPDNYVIGRDIKKAHLSFGFGIHRCLGNRVAELQLTILWEEILKRFPVIELVEEPTRTHSVFVKGYETLPVRIPARN
ncbi:cytochrome P450 [Pseudooceanicola sp. LIPI14-2-Ac024]|uniref:cytochrome P450 n=1 Tax=Pseudooceanicola sp. LIPI14-2-Ac024 TaxID=3344875 RepID=UPI0035CEDA59